MTAYFFILGLIVASFLNALAYRIEKGFLFPDIFTKGSHCEKCGKMLTWVELIPVISYFMYRGRCKKCDTKIFWYYPLSEFLLGLVFALIWVNGISFYFVIPVIILFLLSYFDVTSNSIPQLFVHMALGFGLLDLAVSFGVSSSVEVFYPLILAIVICVGILVLNRFKPSFGMGDILLILFVATLLPMTQFIVFLVMSLLYSAFFSIFLVGYDRKWIKGYIPMVPFMFLAFATAILYSSQLVEMFARTMFLW